MFLGAFFYMGEVRYWETPDIKVQGYGVEWHVKAMLRNCKDNHTKTGVKKGAELASFPFQRNYENNRA